MTHPTRPQIVLKAIYELGFSKLFHYAYYLLKLRSGMLRLQTPGASEQWPVGRGRP